MTEPQKKLTATEARVLLGFPPRTDSQNSRYQLWRTEVAAYMMANGIYNQTQAGTAQWDGVREFAIGHWVILGYKEVYSGTDAVAGKLQEALQALLFDIRAKLSKKRKEASKTNKVFALPPGPTNDRFRAPASHPSQDAPAVPDLTAALSGFARPPAFIPRGVIVYLTDPEAVPGSMCGAVPVAERQWGGRGVFRFVGMVYEPTMEHLVSLALRKTDVDAKRAVRNLLGAMADPVLGASGVITQSPESTVLADDEDVEGWLATSKATPLRLLAILERCGTASSPAT